MGAWTLLSLKHSKIHLNRSTDTMETNYFSHVMYCVTFFVYSKLLYQKATIQNFLCLEGGFGGSHLHRSSVYRQWSSVYRPAECGRAVDMLRALRRRMWRRFRRQSLAVLPEPRNRDWWRLRLGRGWYAVQLCETTTSALLPDYELKTKEGKHSCYQ